MTGGDNLWNEFKDINEANAHLALSAGTVATAVAGAIVVPSLGPLSALLALYGTRRLHARAWHALMRERRVGVALLNTLFIVGALARGYFVLISINSLLYSVSCNLLLRSRATARADTLDALTRFPQTAMLDRGAGTVEEVPLEALEAGALIVVAAGQTVPVDGRVVGGAASIDQQLLTGEAQPVERVAGDPVLALTLVLTGRIRVRVEQTGATTLAAGIAATLARTIDHRSRRQLQAEDIIGRTAAPGLLLGLLAWPLGGVDAALAALNAHPRYKISLVAPLGMRRLLKVGMRRGLLIKDGRVLDVLERVDTVVFDKTGTLTEETPRLAAIQPLEGWHEDGVLALAAALEATQTHPIARCIGAEAQRRALALPAVVQGDLAPGLGVAARVAGEAARIGSLRFQAGAGIPIPTAVATLAESMRARGQGVLAVSIGPRIVGLLALDARIRPEAERVMAALRAGGIRSLVLISGDQEAPTRAVAEALGLDAHHAEALPEQKARIIGEMQARGRVVCFVGDGINDAIALKQARASISLRGAAGLARETADIILLDGSLNGLPAAIALGRDFQRRMRRALVLTLAPAGVALGGVFLLHFGIWQTIVLEQIGLVGGLIAVNGGDRPSLRRRTRACRLVEVAILGRN